MNILINGRFLCRRPTGVDRYATEILRVFDRWYADSAPEVRGVNFEIAVPRRPLMHWQPVAIPVTAVGPSDGHIWEQFVLRRRNDYDALLSLCNTGPLVVRRQLVAIHDATPVRVPESFSRPFQMFYRVLMPALGRMAAQIVTVSKFSRLEIAACYGINFDKISVVANCAEHVRRTPADQSILDRLKLEQGAYVLAVATNARHKNVSILVDVAERLGRTDVRIVLAGGANNRVFDRFSGSNDDRVIRAGFVSDGELRALYENAVCFVFPSLYEGFGIPPLEAMQLGCPVVSSNASAMPEVLGDAALYASPNDPGGFYQAIRRVSENTELRKTMISKGYLRASAYSWVTSARSLLTLCRAMSNEARP